MIDPDQFNDDPHHDLEPASRLVEFFGTLFVFAAIIGGLVYFVGGAS